MSDVTFKISTQACLDIIVTACEGGSNYWLNDHIEDTKRDKDLNYTKLLLKEPSENSEFAGTPPKNFEITAADIPGAISKLIANAGKPGYCHSRIIADIVGSLEEDGCGCDAEAADCVLQVAVFGECLYG